MNLVLLGAPGVGKGTQANYISNYFGIPKISTGDILRSAVKSRTSLGLKVQSSIDEGILVSDDVIVKLVEERLKNNDCIKGYVLDGFPRTLLQATAMEKVGITVDNIIEIIVPFEQIIERVSGRLIHVPSGRVYHKIFKPPKRDNVDDETGEQLVKRIDDKEEIFKERLKIYSTQIRPVIDYYLNLTTNSKYNYKLPLPQILYSSVSGIGRVEEVNKRILKVLNK